LFCVVGRGGESGEIKGDPQDQGHFFFFFFPGGKGVGQKEEGGLRGRPAPFAGRPNWGHLGGRRKKSFIFSP